MAYHFDIFGWYDGESTGERTTDLVPPTVATTTTPGQQRANWTGHSWVSVPYVAQVLDAPRPVVPDSVTMRQARLALLAAGKLDTVTAAIAALPEPQKTAATIEWEYSNDVERAHGMVITLAAAIGLSSADIDALFIAAAKL